MSKTFKPMLAATYSAKFPIRYPGFASPKLDGIRLIGVDGLPMTRSLKEPIRNVKIRTALEGMPSFDGEIVVGTPTDTALCATTQSGVMSEKNPTLEDNWFLYVFDYACPEWKDDPFHVRFGALHGMIADYIDANPHLEGRVRLLAHEVVENDDQLWSLEKKWFEEMGYEGAMFRDMFGKYKWGRSTAREGGLIKFKRWEDAEGIIEEVREELHNGNEAKVNPLGKMERSSHKANKVGKGIIGSYRVSTYRSEDDYFGLDYKDTGEPVSFDLGAAANTTEEQRRKDFDNASDFVGKSVTFRYQWTRGAMKPRIPTFKCIRLD